MQSYFQSLKLNKIPAIIPYITTILLVNPQSNMNYGDYFIDSGIIGLLKRREPEQKNLGTQWLHIEQNGC